MTWTEHTYCMRWIADVCSVYCLIDFHTTKKEWWTAICFCLKTCKKSQKNFFWLNCHNHQQQKKTKIVQKLDFPTFNVTSCCFNLLCVSLSFPKLIYQKKIIVRFLTLWQIVGKYKENKKKIPATTWKSTNTKQIPSNEVHLSLHASCVCFFFLYVLCHFIEQ
jgi:hypothetical protein